MDKDTTNDNGPTNDAEQTAAPENRAECPMVITPVVAYIPFVEHIWVLQLAWLQAATDLKKVREFKPRPQDMPRSWRN